MEPNEQGRTTQPFVIFIVYKCPQYKSGNEVLAVPT